MDMLRIYKLAWFQLMEQREREVERNLRTIQELGRENSISVAKIKTMNEEENFLHEKMLELEKSAELSHK